MTVSTRIVQRRPSLQKWSASPESRRLTGPSSFVLTLASASLLVSGCMDESPGVETGTGDPDPTTVMPTTGVQPTTSTSDTTDSTETGTAGTDMDPDEDIVPEGGLRRHRDCDELLAYASERLLEQQLAGELRLPEQGGGGGSASGGVTTADSGVTDTIWSTSVSSSTATSGSSDSGADVTGSGGGEDSGGGESGGGEGGLPNDDGTGTNLQEWGVDEADIVKSDANRIVALSRGRLHYVDISGPVPELRGVLELDRDYWQDQSELYLVGERAYVLRTTGMHEVPPAIQPHAWLVQGSAGHRPITQITEIDLSVPAEPTIVRDHYLEGQMVSSRRVESTLRVVTRSTPVQLPLRSFLELVDWQGYYYDLEEAYEPSEREAIRVAYESAAKAKAQEYNRKILAEATVEEILPHRVLDDWGGAGASSELMVGCEAAYSPVVAAGMNMLSVVSFDITDGGAGLDAVGIYASGETLYSSADSIYVTTAPWRAPGILGVLPPQQVKTFVHKFRTDQPGAADYVASGSVDGTLMNQWSLSEWQGDLRVVGSFEAAGQPTNNFVAVLRQEASSLQQIGHVANIGRGQDVYAVRFMGPLGYVVTFRRIDPLHVIDLSDPTQPVELGELEIPGFSRYLHPLDDGYLLGIGQSGEWPSNVQVSIFDVRDPQKPQRSHLFDLEGYFTPIEVDHRAFTYDESRKLAIVPIEDEGHWSSTTGPWDSESDTDWSTSVTTGGTDSGSTDSGWDHDGSDATTTGPADETDDDSSGEAESGSSDAGDTTGEAPVYGSSKARAAVLRVDPNDGIELVGEVDHDLNDDPWKYYRELPHRSAVIDGVIYTISNDGIKANDADTLAELSWLAFPPF